MSYQLYLDDECHKCINYTKPVFYLETWKCVVCELKEDAYEDITWFRYELHCGHQVHPRCYKKWCKQEKTVGCPLCGPLPYTEDNMYCNLCNIFGHSPAH